jgi:RNA polymerase sigma-70 factor (ECF subfamily)
LNRVAGRLVAAIDSDDDRPGAFSGSSPAGPGRRSLMTSLGMPALHSLDGTSHGSHNPAGEPGLAAAGEADAQADGSRDPGGTDAAIRGLYEQNARFVLTYVTSLLGDRHLAEDVLQETMLRAWRNCEHFSAEKGSVRGWLIRVAHNIAMDKLRMRRSRPIEVAEASGPEPRVGDHAETVITAVHLREAMAKLSPGHRDVLVQVYLNGLTAGEAAAVLRIPEGTVFSRAYYGLRMLRRALGVPPGGMPRRERQPGHTGALAA